MTTATSGTGTVETRSGWEIVRFSPQRGVHLFGVKIPDAPKLSGAGGPWHKIDEARAWCDQNERFPAFNAKGKTVRVSVPRHDEAGAEAQALIGQICRVYRGRLKGLTGLVQEARHSAEGYDLVAIEDEDTGRIRWVAIDRVRLESDDVPEVPKPAPKDSSEERHGFTVDELGAIQLLSSDVLAAVARGELDLNRVALEHLAGCGLDEHGKWIGFPAARRLHLGDDSES